MKILVTGANGYIGQRLIPILLQHNHQLICCVRDRTRFMKENRFPEMQILEVDFVEDTNGRPELPTDIEAAYYLIHSMSTRGDFKKKEAMSAYNFLQWLKPTHCKQIIYLTGIVNERVLSLHLESRLHVENILRSGTIPLTALRAGIIVGSGSASFEIVRDLVEKLPVMVTPKWLNTKCQPIAIRDVILFLSGVLGKTATFGKHYDITGPEILTYKQMLLQYAQVRKLKRWIFILPVMTPRLSSYWLYFITSTSYPLAVNLVDSMKIDVTGIPNDLATRLSIETIPYGKAVSLAFDKIEQNMVASSWKDSFSSTGTPQSWMKNIEVPRFGCLKDEKMKKITTDEKRVFDKVWKIGGNNGWYYANTLWQIRGFWDKMIGGVGLRRGRTNSIDLHAGDALDFWRVLVADKSEPRLLLFAEMKLPGEAWLEFSMVRKDNEHYLRQVATFRPHGLLGRLYWYLMLPFHYFIFNGMISRIVNPGIK